MDIVGLIANALAAVKEFFGFQTKRLELKNSAPMQKAAAAQNEVNAAARARSAIAKQDVEATRNELAE